jgi:predicted nucleic acid-binding protein
LCAKRWAGFVLVEGLVDTGAMIAMLSRTDRWHSACREAFKGFRFPLITSEAVLTELFYMVADNQAATEAAWALVRSGAVALAPIDNGELAEIQELMNRYRDRPMDFADATLVYLARRESVSTVFTVDHNDFETYRIEGKRRFRILPPRKA